MFDFLIKLDIWINQKVFGGVEETMSRRLGRHIKRDGCPLCKVFCRFFLVPLSVILIALGKQKGFKHCTESANKEGED